MRCLLLAACAAASAAAAASPCSCADPALCNALTSPLPGREVLAFHVLGAPNASAWEAYDWTRITTIAIFGEGGAPPPADLVCAAHAAGARVVLGADFDTTKLGNETVVQQWIDARLSELFNTTAGAPQLDGINLDIEAYAGPSAPLVAFTSRVRAALKAACPTCSLSFDTAVAPNGQNGAYDFGALAGLCDFLVPMAYDEDWAARIASANSPLGAISESFASYAELGVKASSLVMGLPWYGYTFPCTSPGPTAPAPGAGACVSAPGFSGAWSKTYANVVTDLLPAATGGRRWDAASASPYLDVLESGSSGKQWFQTWYDDAVSLSQKVAASDAAGGRGVAVWHAGCLTGAPAADVTAMWVALGNRTAATSAGSQ